MRVATHTKRRTVTRRHDDVSPRRFVDFEALFNVPIYRDPREAEIEAAGKALGEVLRDVQSAADHMALERPMFYAMNEDKSTTPLYGPDASLKWSRTFEKNRRVAWDELEGVGYVSTVFLGMDHAFGNGPPQLFETMARIGDHWAEEVMRRYSTYEDALAGHNELVAEHRASQAGVDKLKGAGDA